MDDSLDVKVGFCTECGPRESNGDYGMAHLGTEDQRRRWGVVLVLADGVGGAKGGRVAAEAAAKTLIDGYYSHPETVGAERAAAVSIDAANRWIFAQGKNDPALASMACTLTALVLRGRQAHIAHIGDTRLYRLRDGKLEQLTSDHTFGSPDTRHMLLRALGAEANSRVDYAVDATRIHDRYLLCTDGVHGALRDREIRDLLLAYGASQSAAEQLVATALAAGSKDNTTALVADIANLPKTNQTELQVALSSLPILEPPAPGVVVDGFELRAVLADGRYSRIFDAFDLNHQRRVVVKFPKPAAEKEMTVRLGTIREIWVPSRVRSEWVGEVIEQAAERQTRLYSVMPFYDGETLEQRIMRKPRVGLEEGVEIAIKVTKAAAALHRARIVHRDIKPENVILGPNGGLRLIDLGVAHLPQAEEFPLADIPGTPSYMAPELFDGELGSELSDQFAVGVTIYRMFTGGYPYGEVERFARPRFGKATSLQRQRPELPPWLDLIVSRAVAVDPAARFADTVELAFELENGLRMRAQHAPTRRRPLYQRNPVLVWQLISAALLALLVLVLSSR